MEEFSKCDICGKKATVHLSQVINGDLLKAELCEACAQEKGLLSQNILSLPSTLLKLAIPHTEAQQAQVACPFCGLTPLDFKKTGRLGCPDCYTSLQTVLVPVLQSIHRVVEHKGKVPRQALNRVSLQRQLSELQVNLKAAIQEERYEDAARYRDAISQAKLEASHES